MLSAAGFFYSCKTWSHVHLLTPNHAMEMSVQFELSEIYFAWCISTTPIHNRLHIPSLNIYDITRALLWTYCCHPNCTCVSHLIYSRSVLIFLLRTISYIHVIYNPNSLHLGLVSELSELKNHIHVP